MRGVPLESASAANCLAEGIDYRLSTLTAVAWGDASEVVCGGRFGQDEVFASRPLQSPFSDAAHPLHSTNYQRVLAVNIYDEWTMRHPREFPDGSNTYGGSEKNPKADQPGNCSGFAALGRSTRNEETIAAQNRHGPYDPRCYQQVFVIQPADGVVCWVLTNSPQVAANQVVNQHGVSISLFAGGTTNERSLAYEGESYSAEAFGVPWFHLFLHTGTQAKTAREAIDMLTVGTPDYRKHTGRASLLRGGGWIFMVSDPTEIVVVEVTADRYAVRRPGEFTGPEWNDPDYIVATNHNLCPFSFNENNQRTDIPMTIFGDGFARNAAGEIIGLDNSGIRFWTLMWDIKRRRGEVDATTAQDIMSGLHSCDRISGAMTIDTSGEGRIWGRACNQGTVSLSGGTVDGKVACLRDAGTVVDWTLGSPSHWRGRWDSFSFHE